MFFQKDMDQNFYFLGIGGVSMSALALLLKDKGFSVRGSDCAESEFTNKLKSRGIDVHIGQSEQIWEHNVVYSGAIDGAHPQLLDCIRAGKCLYSRAELLGKIAEEYPKVISIAGCHGKTSTTAMLAHIFKKAKRKFTCHIGGEDLTFSNYTSSGKQYFLTEACEYQRSFLSLKSDTAIILNTDHDHADCYSSEEDLNIAYEQFAKQAKNIVINSNDVRMQKLPHAVTFGLHFGDVHAENIYCEGEKYSFTVCERGISTISIHLSVVGKVQIENALACYAAARLYGFSAQEIKRGVESFQGVKRRFECVGTFYGVQVICDYAHHPKEIESAIFTANRLCKGTLRVVFQPHTYSRTKAFIDDFVKVLKKVENPVVYKTYAARESFDTEGSAFALTSKIPEAIYVQTPQQLKIRLMQMISSKDLILVLGAGNIYQIAKDMIDENPSE